ncbi:MAG: transporter substrate-binding domain-containing protein [Pseudomonadota bacterium]
MAALPKPTNVNHFANRASFIVLVPAVIVFLAFCYNAIADETDESSIVAVESPAPFPDFLGPRTDIEVPDVRGVTRFRFLTTTDFPPFNYVDGRGQIAGFHVDLARNICAAAGLGARCQIEAIPFEELEAALASGRGEAVIAGQSALTFSDGSAVASKAFFRFPGRFVRRTDALNARADPLDLPPSTRVVVIEGSAHEAYLRAFFPNLAALPVPDRRTLQLALTSAIADHGFDDAVATATWLAEDGASACCSFASGPYFSDRYFGAGLTAATRANDSSSAQIIEYALYELRRRNAFQEIYLRHFPIGPF